MFRTLVGTAFLFTVSLGAQMRGIVPEDIVGTRPAGSAAPVKPKYQPVATSHTQMTKSEAKQIGVTVWKLRKSGAADTGARILIQEDAASVELIPERVGSATELTPGDKVRLSIESGVEGFLYVIDRELYSSGAGDSYLIFPTTRTRGGDNHVAAGRLIDIPGQADQPNFFTLRRSRAEQLGEELLVIVSDKPMEGIQIGSKALLLKPEQVAQFERQWTAPVEKFELTGGAGKAWTLAEQQASSSQTRVLTQDEPAPQTIYRVASGPNRPALVKVELRLAKR